MIAAPAARCSCGWARQGAWPIEMTGRDIQLAISEAAHREADERYLAFSRIVCGDRSVRCAVAWRLLCDQLAHILHQDEDANEHEQRQQQRQGKLDDDHHCGHHRQRHRYAANQAIQGAVEQRLDERIHP